jgi:hypothetical protein
MYDQLHGENWKPNSQILCLSSKTFVPPDPQINASTSVSQMRCRVLGYTSKLSYPITSFYAENLHSLWFQDILVYPHVVHCAES